MTKVVDIVEAQAHLKGLLAQARSGDEIIIEEIGKAPVHLRAIAERKQKPLELGLREGEGWSSEDFDDELPDSFWLGDDE